MARETAIQTALDAEREARRIVDASREEAVSIRQDARQKAREIEERANARVQKMHSVVERQLEARRKVVESEGAEALRKLRLEAIGTEAMERTIGRLIDRILVGSGPMTRRRE